LPRHGAPGHALHPQLVTGTRYRDPAAHRAGRLDQPRRVLTADSAALGDGSAGLGHRFHRWAPARATLPQAWVSRFARPVTVSTFSPTAPERNPTVDPVESSGFRDPAKRAPGRASYGYVSESGERGGVSAAVVIGGLLASVVTTSSASAAILTAEECGTAAGTPAVEAVAISQVRAIK